MINFLKELLKEPKSALQLALFIIALILAAMLYQVTTGSIQENTNSNKAVAAALSANTAVMTQFQSLLLDVAKKENVRSAIMESIVQK